MTSGQRKAHTYIWLLLALLIPVIMVFSIKDLEWTQLDSKGISEISSVKKGVLKTSENTIIKASLYPKNLEIIVKKPIKNASALVYEVDNRGLKRALLGQISAVGIYTFSARPSISGIIIIDGLKETEITKLNF